MGQNSALLSVGKALENPTLPPPVLVRKATNIRDLNSSVFFLSKPLIF
jgi:hypothetical protein